jgi:Rps23 Pro-64 3,4-dihydroxylase Tpa1-like proline 4-hydroxylase
MDLLLNLNNLENDNILKLKEKFDLNKKLVIKDFLTVSFAENLFKYAFFEKNWILATGIDKNKYEKADIQQNIKINQLQIKNVNNAFGKDQFSYNFYRTMNANKMSLIELTIRNIFNSKDFLNKLSEITGLELTKLTTLFMSKYKNGSFLSPHSDKGNGRIAFVLNLSKFWKPQYGGVLHFMNDNRTDIIDSYVPLFNSLMIFEVPKESGIPHFVSHVSPNVKFNRYAITGWFD